MNLPRSLKLAPLLLGLAACAAVGPNYQLPADAAINSPLVTTSALTGDQGPAISRGAVPGAWWRLYDDPVLDGLVREALRSNTDLRVAAGNLARSRAALGVARAAGGFGGDASAAVKRAQEAGEAFLLPAEPPIATEGDFGLSISYQFDLFGTLHRGVEAARADADSVQAAADIARITVVADVVRAYIANCATAEDTTIAQHSVALQNRSSALVGRLRAAGRANQPDVTRAQTQTETLRADIPRLRARQRAAQYRLAMLLARAPETLPPAVLACHVTPTIKQALPVGDGAAMLKRRPDVRQAERKLAAATARIGVATGALYPTVTLGASAGLTGLAADLGSPATQRYGFGPLISWTFPAHGARMRVREAEASSQVALAQFDGVVLNALRETETALATYAGDLARLDALRAAQKSAAQAADETHRFYQAGRVSFIAELDAARTLSTADAQVASAREQVAQDQVNLFLALGGGWEHDSGSAKAQAR